MTPEAERTVSPDLATALVHAQFPFITGDLVPLDEGWDNAVYTEGGAWAFRFPRREAALPMLEREGSVLASLAPHLPLPVPVPLLRGEPTEAFPWPFTGAALLAGAELADAPVVDRVGLATDVGGFLRALHALRPVDGLPVDPMRRGWPRHREAMTREALSTLSELGPLDVDAGPLLERTHALGPPTTQVVVHGDLHLRHVLVGSSGRATGVIDWGDCCLADPAVDLSYGFAAFEGEALEAFLSSYGSVGAEQELRARALALNLCAVLAVSAHEQGRARLLPECLAGVRRACCVDGLCL